MALGIPQNFRQVLIISTEPNTPHFETSLEIAVRLAKDGRTVHHQYLYPPYHEFLNQPNRRQVRRWVSGGQRRAEGCVGANLSVGWQDASSVSVRMPTSATLEDADRWCGFRDLSNAVRSSISGRLSSLCFDETENRALIAEAIASGISVYEATRDLIRKMNPDLVIFFNGRFVNSRAVWRACETEGVAWASHERGGQDNRFFLEVGMTPHDHRGFQRLADHRPHR